MNIAIIGSGISGLTCGYLLHQQHQITLFEANDYIGGHTHTVDVQRHDQVWPVDTGFIVFNDRTYPLFQVLLNKNQRSKKTRWNKVRNQKRNLI